MKEHHERHRIWLEEHNEKRRIRMEEKLARGEVEEEEPKTLVRRITLGPSYPFT